MNLDRTPLELAWVAPGDAPPAAWPHPVTERWQPLRLGLVDFYHYDDEQFWFHDGRLLLRGNNGTGKSKVLALTLPFLLDGSLLPRRVEPDADPRKRMEWNLLLGGEHPGTERSGYAWVEFGRVDADGAEHFTTLGIGLKAATGRGIVKTWYFTSSRRVGELRLVDDDRLVLSQERLRDHFAEVGGGQVLGTQEAYRRAVDEALFRLGEERYAALVDLLLQLRQPQLSRKPDEKALSAALTEALTPLDQAVVADVAESFRSIEDERAGVAEAKETLGAAEGFLGHYRGYAEVAARRRTTAVREANSTYEWAGRDLREAESARVTAQDVIERLARDSADAEDQHSALRGRERALRESPEMRDADRLHRADADATAAEQRSEEAQSEEAEARTAAVQEGEIEREEAAQALAAEEEGQRLGADALRLAGRAGLAESHAAHADDEQAARRALDRRREQVRHVRGLVETDRAAREQAQNDRAMLDRAEGEAAQRAEAAGSAEAAVESAVTGHVDAVRVYLAGLSVLALGADAGELVDRVEGWARGRIGDSPARAAVAAAVNETQDRIARDRAVAERQLADLEVDEAKALVEIAELEAGRDPAPPPAPGRDPEARVGLPGAPLWRLTDFAEHIPDSDRAGIEAALQSAGLLDAWLFPDGTVQARGDVVLSGQGPAVEPSVAEILMPAVGPDDVVPVGAVEGVLRRIGLGESAGAPLWVDRAGRWGAGPARGAWAKPRPEHIGAGAREVSRRGRLDVLAGLVADLEQQQASVADRLSALHGRTQGVREESARYPGASEVALATAHAEARAAQRELSSALAAVDTARSRTDDADRTAERSSAELADQATQLRLGTTTSDLDAVSDAIGEYAAALVGARTAARGVAETARAHATARRRAAAAEATLRRREDTAVRLRTQALDLRAQAEALRATVGASVADLQARLADVAQATADIEGALKDIAKRQLAAANGLGTLEEKVRDLRVRREETSRVRDHEVTSLRSFVATGLLRIALPEAVSPDPDADQEWHVTAAVALSRTVEQHLERTEASDEAWSRVQQRASSAATELTSRMSRLGHTAVVEQRGDVQIARVRFSGDEVDVDRLALRLAEDIADRERLLSAREREILENHLVNEVAGHLHELLLAAEAQIEQMNVELAERRTSTGMQLRVRWRERPDAPGGLAPARELMVRSDATWTAADRGAIGEFLQARITEVRLADPTGSWQEHLEQALDYRHWHSFTVERLQNGRWVSASGPASGGEKALAVTVPLFAAASAHYNSASAQAPRLILLDEAFAGVDDDSRAKSLGLLATFDLDVVMTSEREWGCYPQVPGLSIVQLSRVEGIDAIGVSRWRWDGQRRVRVDDVEGAARASGRGPSTPPGDSLFG